MRRSGATGALVVLLALAGGCDETAPAPGSKAAEKPSAAEAEAPEAKARPDADAKPTPDADAKPKPGPDAKADPSAEAVPTPETPEPEANATAAAEPEPVPEPTPAPTGPIWSLTCTKGKTYELTARVRPDDYQVVSLGAANGSGHARTWPRPDALVLFSDLPQKVFALLSPPSGPAVEPYVTLYAMPKTFRLDGDAARFKATFRSNSLDGSNGLDDLKLQCEMNKEGSP